jgi:hypothetical protein
MTNDEIVPLPEGVSNVVGKDMSGAEQPITLTDNKEVCKDNILK